MATRILPKIARRAHHTVALDKPLIKVGATLPGVALKDLEGKSTVRLDELKGKNVIVGVPGAFTPSCSSQVPGYLEKYEKFKAKGVNDIYVLAVNDFFVMKAWKDKMAASGTEVKFVSDDKADFVSELGLALDATGLLGNVRSKRFALVTDSGKVTKVAVEDVASDVTVTAADKLLGEI